jgi:hypothetical protein
MPGRSWRHEHLGLRVELRHAENCHRRDERHEHDRERGERQDARVNRAVPALVPKRKGLNLGREGYWKLLSPENVLSCS